MYGTGTLPRYSSSARPSRWPPDKEPAGEEVGRFGTLFYVIITNRSWSEIMGLCLLLSDSYMFRQLLHWRGRVPGTKALNRPLPVPSRGQLQQVWKIVPAGIEVPGLDTATTSSSSVHALKKRRLEIKSGSGLYTARNFTHLCHICAKGFFDSKLDKTVIDKISGFV